MKVIERIVKSEGAPSENDLWLDHASGNPELKEYHNGEWVSLVKSLQDQVESLKSNSLEVITIDADIHTPKDYSSIPNYSQINKALAVKYNGRTYLQNQMGMLILNTALALDIDYVIYAWGTFYPTIDLANDYFEIASGEGVIVYADSNGKEKICFIEY